MRPVKNKHCNDNELSMLKKKHETNIIEFKYITPVISLQSLDNLNYQLMGCDFIDECIAHKKDVHINSVYTLQSLRTNFESI